ncbi:hypothetical protein LTR86_005799 [Recurvomyces mirabilis]|nr:hypothetical protein LTR86_005799 [Recurvomyces mirabilis]
MASRHYKPSGPVNPAIEPDLSVLAGKTAIVTGGASGLGEAYVRALVNAKLVKQMLADTKYVNCDVFDWDDQLRLSKDAIDFSPSGKIHYVVANAGVAKKPDTSIINVDLVGVLYTAKLAMHYFVKQNGIEPSPSQEDTALILISSGAGFLDCPRGPQYAACKFAMRGFMASLRKTTHFYGSRVNIISPWYVKTKILPAATWKYLTEIGVEFATLEDAQHCLTHILSDQSINGRNLFLSPRKWAPKGYLDLGLDDFSGNKLITEIQADQVKSNPPENGLWPEGDGW